MFILAIVLAAVCGGGFIMAGIAKVLGQQQLVENLTNLGVPRGLWKPIGLLEVLGGAGLFVGLHADLPIIGVLAAAGLVAMSIGAVYYHQMAGDAFKESVPALVLGSLAIFYAIARIGSA